MVNVLIVEDQRMIRSLLESYIAKEDGYKLYLSISGAGQAAEICKNAHIDLVLMDVQTEHRESGLHAAAEIKKHKPNTKIIIITSLVDYEVLKKAKSSGADSLWYKDGDEDTLMDVIRRTMQGEHIFPDRPPNVPIGTAQSSQFTKSELKVLRYIVRGLSYSKIAELMEIEPSTVKFHVSNMLQKTNLENKLQLALAVSDVKLISDMTDIDE